MSVLSNAAGNSPDISWWNGLIWKKNGKHNRSQRSSTQGHKLLDKGKRSWEPCHKRRRITVSQPPDAPTLKSDQQEKSTSPSSLEDSCLKAKIAKVKALVTRWDAEDFEEKPQGKDLVACQRQRCKDIRMIIFGFLLWEVQVDAVWNLFLCKNAISFF